MFFNWRFANEDEREFAYSHDEEVDKETCCVGHLRVTMTDDDWFTRWENHCPGLNTDEFRSEFNDVVNDLRREKEMDCVLKDFDAVRNFCWKHRANKEARDEEGLYYLRLDTNFYSYIVRLTPMRGYYPAYIYCYEKKPLDNYLSKK